MDPELKELRNVARKELKESMPGFKVQKRVLFAYTYAPLEAHHIEKMKKNLIHVGLWHILGVIWTIANKQNEGS